MKPSDINFEIVYPSVRAPGLGRENYLCGDSWSKRVEIRAPYRNVNTFVVDLRRITGDFGITDNDSESDKSGEQLAGATVQGFLDSAIANVQGALNISVGSGYIPASAESAIRDMIGKSELYFSAARSIQEYWILYKTDPSKPLPGGWPIEMNDPPPGCIIWTDEDDFFKTNSSGKFCPDSFAAAGHASDRVKFLKLMRAAIKQCRCAQEAQAAVSVYYKNREKYNNSGSQLGLAKRPKVKRVRASVINGLGLGGALESGLNPDPPPDPPPEDNPFPDLAGESPNQGQPVESDVLIDGDPLIESEVLIEGDPSGQDAEAPVVPVSKNKPKKKGSGSVMLIAAAAAIGLMIVKR